jgi:hypothetical protein
MDEPGTEHGKCHRGKLDQAGDSADERIVEGKIFPHVWDDLRKKAEAEAVTRADAGDHDGHENITWDTHASHHDRPLLATVFALPLDAMII